MLSINRRILIVDDNVDIHNDFRKILQGSAKKSRENLKVIEAQLFSDEEKEQDELAESAVTYEIDSAYQGLDGIKMVEQAHGENRPYALIFMDVRMPPGIDGIETISRVWARYPNTEMIICTAYSDYSFEEILDKLGSTDRLLFLTKPFDSIAVKQMALSLTRKWTLHEQARRHVLQLKEEIDQRKSSENRLHHMIHHDTLTGLANRNQLQISLKGAIAQAKQCNTRFALLFVDLDRFRDVNNTLGYRNGDRLIKKISERLQKMFGNKGTVFCQSSNEFAILLPEITSLQHITQVATNIQVAFEPPFVLDEMNIEIQPNVGIVIYPDHGIDIDMLMRHADMTLINARKVEQGIKFFHKTMNRYSHQRLMLLSDLRDAINASDLILYFQPKVNLRTNKIVGVEALIRWPHAEYGFIPPNDFIPIAESCGMIWHLTKWVLTEVPKQWAVWKEQGLDLSISLNLTAVDLQNPQLAGLIESSLGEYDMPAKRLTVEVSEKGVMADPEQAIHTMRRIAETGIVLSIDNFGTGHSSLAYLKRLPVQEIKIDSSFVRDLRENSNEMAIVRSMVDLGHNLGLHVLADGVSSKRSFQKLLKVGCDYLQGGVVNNAVPSGELALWLKESVWNVETEDDSAVLAH